MNHAPWYGGDDWVHLARTSANKEGTKHKLALRLLSPLRISLVSADSPYGGVERIGWVQRAFLKQNEAAIV
jgi:hypothetical protein